VSAEHKANPDNLAKQETVDETDHQELAVSEDLSDPQAQQEPLVYQDKLDNQVQLVLRARPENVEPPGNLDSRERLGYRDLRESEGHLVLPAPRERLADRESVDYQVRLVYVVVQESRADRDRPDLRVKQAYAVQLVPPDNPVLPEARERVDLGDPWDLRAKLDNAVSKDSVAHRDSLVARENKAFRDHQDQLDLLDRRDQLVREDHKARVACAVSRDPLDHRDNVVLQELMDYRDKPVPRDRQASLVSVAQ